jgi:hypothetical protein
MEAEMDTGIHSIAEYFYKNEDIEEYIVIDNRDEYDESQRILYEKINQTFLKYQIYLKIIKDNAEGKEAKSLNTEISFTRLFELYDIPQTIRFEGIHEVDYLSIQNLNRFATCFIPRDTEYRVNIDGIATLIDGKLVLIDIANNYENICFSLITGTKSKFNIILVSYTDSDQYTYPDS